MANAPASRVNFGNRLNLWRSFRTHCSVPNFGISKSAWFINHLETISKAYVRILGLSTWNQKEYLKRKPKIRPPLASTSAPTHLTQTATSPLSTQKNFESTVPKVSWQQESAVLRCNDQQTPVTITETSKNNGSNKTKKTVRITCHKPHTSKCWHYDEVHWTVYFSSVFNKWGGGQ